MSNRRPGTTIAIAPSTFQVPSSTRKYDGYPRCSTTSRTNGSRATSQTPPTPISATIPAVATQ
ncbi:MAG: hypothetical protein ABSA93_32755 [Streptosporangiaceae bacterium]